MLAKKLKPCAAQVAKSWQSSHHSYATLSSPDNNFSHHPIWPSTPWPTPYQILDMDPMCQKYSKSRFAELVKLYHPDRAVSADPRCRNLSETVRLERYHMAVTAHDILSNPDKRLAYDRYGAGWSSFSMPVLPSTGYTSTIQYHSYNGRGFDPYSARKNATWEDWEQWRASRADRSDNGSQSRGEPVYMPHKVFATVLFVASITAGMAQHKSAKNIAYQRGLWRDEMNANALREYESRKKSKSSRSKDERIESFAKSRDPSRLSQQQ